MFGVHAPGFIQLYHATAASSVASILATGLFPPEPVRHPGQWWMLTSDRADAVSHALRKPLGDRAIITYRVPADQLDAYLWPPHEISPGIWWYTLRKPLPRSMMQSVDCLPAQSD